MKTPAFWNKKSLLSTCLLPLGWIYAGATALRLKLKKPFNAEIPVICIGNLTAGGTGKTPTAAAIARLLQEQGYSPFFISRGYGGKLQNIIVAPQKHRAVDVGDEPLLLARTAPVAVNADRKEAAILARQNGADIVIMDDGFQNPGLHKDLSFIVIDGEVGLGNFRPVPAGPLRENFQKGIARADAAVIIGTDKTNVRSILKNIPVFAGKIKPQTPPFSSGARVIAFAGIGRPEKFYHSLQECRAVIVKSFSFPDHHFYTETELQKLINEARKENAVLCTTSKDFVKIPPNLRPFFCVLEIGIAWQDEDALKDFIFQNLPQTKSKNHHK